MPCDLFGEGLGKGESRSQERLLTISMHQCPVLPEKSSHHSGTQP